MSTETEHLDRIGAAVLKRLRESDDSESVQNIQTLVFRLAAEEEAKQPAVERAPEAIERANAELAKAVRQLPSVEREALKIHVCDGLTYKQIAARLEMPEAAVLRNLRMAYSKIASVMRKAG